jgi:ribosomal protein S24E
VVKKLTSKTKIQNDVAKASKTDPQYLVESDKTDTKAAHKPNQIKKNDP